MAIKHLISPTKYFCYVDFHQLCMPAKKNSKMIFQTGFDKIRRSLTNDFDKGRRINSDFLISSYWDSVISESRMKLAPFFICKLKNEKIRCVKCVRCIFKAWRKSQKGQITQNALPSKSMQMKNGRDQNVILIIAFDDVKTVLSLQSHLRLSLYQWDQQLVTHSHSRWELSGYGPSLMAHQ